MEEVDPSTPNPGGLVCIEYPGLVHNVDKAVATLGGLATIGQVVAEPNRRLELRYRPSDVYCKPACGERHHGSAFLLKVRRMRLKKGREGQGKPQVKMECKVEGTVEVSYRFTNLCDFQYLPMARNPIDEAVNLDNDQTEPVDPVPETPSHLSIYDQVYFKRLVDSNWLDTPAPLFIPPAAFSRMDLPQDYQYRREAAAASEKAVATPHNIIGRTRQRRSHHAIFVTFDVEQVPTKPRDVALNQLKLKFIDQERFQLVKEKFSERPAWSKNALNAITRISAERLKFMLPALAYYFTTGPWRNQWIRFGYDPRKHSESSKYQTLDYRVRLQGGARHKVTAKRSYANYLLPYKAINWSKPRTSVINKTSFPGAEQMIGEDAEEGEKEKEKNEKLLDVYLFREGRIPPYRQMFYQYGDLQLESVQLMLAACTMSTKCDEKSGWYPSGTEEKLREILTQNINSKLTEERMEEEEEEDGLNDSALQSDSADSQSETEMEES